MPVPRFFFILWVCVPCLFIDDAVRSELVPIDMATNSKEVYCQILEEKKNVSVLAVMEESNVPAWDDVFLGQIQVMSGFQVPASCYVQAENVISFALFSIQVQQHTSRPKTDTVPIRILLLSTDPSGFSGTNACFHTLGMKSLRKGFSAPSLLSSTGSIDDFVLFDPFPLKPSELSDCHNCRFKFVLPCRQTLSLFGRG